AAKRPTPATASAMNLSMVFVSLSAAWARSRFHPQRAQKGLLERAKNWRSGTEEPQRGQVIPFTKIILVELFFSEEGEFSSSWNSAPPTSSLSTRGGLYQRVAGRRAGDTAYRPGVIFFVWIPRNTFRRNSLHLRGGGVLDGNHSCSYGRAAGRDFSVRPDHWRLVFA